MRALVVGYGSIGQRHARLLEELGHSIALVSRRGVSFSNKWDSLSLALGEWAPDYVVIASRTNEHFDDLSTLANSGYSGVVLIEKPLFHQAISLPAHSFSRAYVAFNLRFHPVTQALRRAVADKNKIAAHAYVGQYLPDWRPQQDYRLGYSAIKKQGGGVLRDLCHELDYMNWILGGWIELTALGGHHSHLEIDSDDVFSVMFRAKDCPVATVNMNYLDDHLRREVAIITDEGTVKADFVAGTVTCGEETQHFSIERDTTYRVQHEAALRGDESILCSLEDGAQVLRMIDAAEQASEQNCWVSH